MTKNNYCKMYKNPLKSIEIDLDILEDFKMTKNNYGKMYKNPLKSIEVDLNIP